MKAVDETIGDAASNLSRDEFIARAASIQTYSHLQALRQDAIATENLFRELFARRRESWEIPEIDDPYVFLVDVFQASHIFHRLPRFQEQDTTPRCFELPQRAPEGTSAISPSREDFLVSWDCLTEGLLRFVNWDNLFAAGGAVAGCLAPLPQSVVEGGRAATRVKRRKYFHDEILSGSDIDLFLYGLNQDQAERKLQEIYDAVQAADPYEIRAFRSAHAITLVSQYPFRHVQIVLRLYNSPSEVLMGFDVDSCAVGFNGTDVYCCPRTALAIMTQTNIIDLSRRSPSYEMRLAKYAQRGFEVLVPGLDRDRVDPFLYERRFDQTKGLARLLLLERLRTPEERLRYRLESQIKSGLGRSNEYLVQRQFRKATRDYHNLERAEGTDGVPIPATGAEMSNYSTIFLPWGPAWNARKIERLMLKKDKILNNIEILPNGKVIKCRRAYKVHVCAIGTMEEIINDPFPDDPPLPDKISEEDLQSMVVGRLTWLVDNPGRQQIGSFHPITDEDWTEGTYFSHAAEELMLLTAANNGEAISTMLEGCESTERIMALIASKDYHGRSTLHVAALAQSTNALRTLLQYADSELLRARLPDGRTVLHLAAIQGNDEITKLILERKESLQGMDNQDALDIDCADWDVKMSPLQYAVNLGNVSVARTLLSHGADVRKIAVHKDMGRSLSILTLLAHYGCECGSARYSTMKEMLDLLMEFGASVSQVDANGTTCWHRLAASSSASAVNALETFLDVITRKVSGALRGLDILDDQMQSALYLATACGNSQGVRALLKAGSIPAFERHDWEVRRAQIRPSGYYRSTVMDEYKRCPISLAAQNADGPCLEAFLSSTVSLANATIDKSFDSELGPEMKSLTPLDILQSLLSNVVRNSTSTWMLERILIQRLENHITECEDKIEEASEKRDQSASTSYQHLIWTLVVEMEKHNLSAKKRELESIKPDTELEICEKLAEQQIREAIQIVRIAGGTSLLDLALESPADPDWQKSSKQQLLDPFANIQELAPLDLSQACQMRSSHAHHIRYCIDSLTTYKKHRAKALFDAVAEGHANTIHELATTTKVAIVDSFRITPMFLSTMKRDVSALRTIFEACKEQYALYMESEMQKRIEHDGAGGSQGTDSEGLIKDQLRRLNNIEIAEGQVPMDSGPTPEELRQKLDLAEAAALGQSTAAELETQQPPSSHVSPAILMLVRSTVLPDPIHNPELVELKHKLAESNPEVFPMDWVSHPVLLRPIELSVIRKDIPMLKCLLQMANDPSFDSSSLVLKNNVSPGTTHGENQDEFSNHGRRTESAISIIAAHHLRFLLAGEGSRIPDLGGMTLLQLAIATDCAEVFSLVAGYSKEYALPRAAIAYWKDSVEKETSSSGATHEARSRQRETDLILGRATGSYYTSLTLPMWSSDAGTTTRAFVHSTHLQFALALRAHNIARQLMSGQADFSLIEWIDSMVQPSDTEYTELSSMWCDFRNNESSLPIDLVASAAAAHWLYQHLRRTPIAKSALALKLVRPTAVDGLGRTALFYADASMLGEVADSAVRSIIQCDRVRPATEAEVRMSFLETTTVVGSVTALMAAASAGEVDRVKALLNCGCKRYEPCGPKRWGPLHLAIPATHKNSCSKQHWISAREIITAILDGASLSEIDNALIHTEAEHTPLMLALDRGGDRETISLLMDKASSGLIANLSRRDVELNSCLHLAVRQALSKGLASKNIMDGIEIMMELADLPFETGPCAENTRGVTPLDMALLAVSSIWDRYSHSCFDDGRNKRCDERYNRCVERREALGKEPLPPLLAKDKKNDLIQEENIARRIVSLLSDSARDKKGFDQRLLASFTDVQTAKKKATDKSRDSTEPRSSPRAIQGTVDDDFQDEPTGSPVVLDSVINTAGYYGGRESFPVEWYAWPRL